MVDGSADGGGDYQQIRLQKVMATAGVGSRRYCEILIGAGRVRVDGQVVREQGLRVDPATAVIHVDGERIASAPGTAVYLLNKPRGMHTTMSDPQGRLCVGDAVAGLDVRLFHVGRLDADTEGLLVLTNDGELANRLTHPSHGVAKTYLAWVPGRVSSAVLRQLRTGVDLDGRAVEVDRVRVVESVGGESLVELEIHEGRNHVVRRLLAEVGHPVSRLMRTRFGPLSVGTLRPGALRRLGSKELRTLYTAAGL
ncbi:MAG TPA: pseudouridine synthase [Actinomycetota bacterium]|nr:pseudouridine synthase [Actinomycetota bacterium]